MEGAAAAAQRSPLRGAVAVAVAVAVTLAAGVEAPAPAVALRVLLLQDRRVPGLHGPPTRAPPAVTGGAGMLGPRNSRLVAEQDCPSGVNAAKAEAAAPLSALTAFKASCISLHSVENWLASLDPVLISSHSFAPISTHV